MSGFAGCRAPYCIWSTGLWGQGRNCPIWVWEILRAGTGEAVPGAAAYKPEREGLRGAVTEGRVQRVGAERCSGNPGHGAAGTVLRGGWGWQAVTPGMWQCSGSARPSCPAGRPGKAGVAVVDKVTWVRGCVAAWT